MFADMTYSVMWMLRMLGYPPTEWQLSQACPISKHNGKEGCLGMRLLNLLDDMGKAWSLQLWQRACHEYDICSYGFIPGRRKEGAILQVNCALWRAHRIHRSTVACLWDVSNAFPSLSHTALDRAVDEVHNGQDAVLAKDR
eukprot:13772887-Heterocapsa_arctica.AAC.1